MPGDRFRFHPPGCELTPALRWTLKRAYASPATAPTALDAAGGLAPPPAGQPDFHHGLLEDAERALVLHWSRALGLSERIANRQQRAAVDSEAGAEAAGALWLARDTLAARSLLLQRLLEMAAATAARLDCRVLALKGIVLLETGVSAWGGRPLLDVDLLVAPDRAAELSDALQADGLQPSGSSERHHLAPLADRNLGELELHVELPGIALDGATPGDLQRAGLAEESSRLPGLLLPGTRLLVAHLVTHAIDQHGLSPTAYPVTRLAADLLDLAAARRLRLPDLIEQAAPLLRSSVSNRERASVVALCELLAAGEDPLATAGDASLLLAHTIASLVQPRYRRSLRRRAALRALRRGDWRKLRPRAADRRGASATTAAE